MINFPKKKLAVSVIERIMASHKRNSLDVNFPGGGSPYGKADVARQGQALDQAVSAPVPEVASPDGFSDAYILDKFL